MQTISGYALNALTVIATPNVDYLLDENGDVILDENGNPIIAD